jgi:hypothetical protein
MALRVVAGRGQTRDTLMARLAFLIPRLLVSESRSDAVTNRGTLSRIRMSTTETIDQSMIGLQRSTSGKRPSGREKRKRRRRRRRGPRLHLRGKARGKARLIDVSTARCNRLQADPRYVYLAENRHAENHLTLHPIPFKSPTSREPLSWI